MATPGIDIVLSNMLSEWGDIPYAELSIMFAHLKVLYELHHNHHLIAKGDSFYGDHLLFQRLYEKVFEEVDQVAEKVIGLGSEENVNLSRLMNHVNKVLMSLGSSGTIPSSASLVQKSLKAEKNFVTMVSILALALKEKGMLTRGLDNMIAGIEDTHEGHIYLLQQRLGK